MNRQNVLTQEKIKSEEEKAEDIAYTINHALVCATTDVIDPFVAAWSQKNLGKKLHTSWCNLTHDHGHGGHCHHHHDHKVTFGGSLKHWVIGEAIGDIGAVPVTIAFQRFTPGIMNSLNKGIESVLGTQYRKGAQKSAQRWAESQGINKDSVQAKEYENEMYRYEVKHFGQAAVWTVASIGLNIASQKFITGNNHPLSHLLLYKSLGAATSATLLLGGRAYAPEKFHSWDKWTAENMFAPATRSIGQFFGVKENAIEKVLKKEKMHADASWQEKVADDKKESGVPALSG